MEPANMLSLTRCLCPTSDRFEHYLSLFFELKSKIRSAFINMGSEASLLPIEKLKQIWDEWLPEIGKRCRVAFKLQSSNIQKQFQNY